MLLRLDDGRGGVLSCRVRPMSWGAVFAPTIAAGAVVVAAGYGVRFIFSTVWKLFRGHA